MFSNQTMINAMLPVLIVRGKIPLPNNEIRLDLGRKEAILALKAAAESKKYVVLFVQIDHNVEVPAIDNIHKTGVVAKIIYDMESQGLHKVKLLGIVRCNLLDITETDPYWTANVVTVPMVNDDLDKELAYVRLLIEELQTDAVRIFDGNSELANIVAQGVTADKLTDVLAYSLPFDLNTKLKYLNTPNVGDRLRFMLEDIKREKYIRNLETEIENEVKKSISESQKEYYLREKMKVIQDELGDKVKQETEIEDLKKKILAAECLRPSRRKP